MRLRDHDAFGHHAYEGAKATAARRAHADPGSCHCVYWDGATIYLRISTAIPPLNAKVVCIAQHWSERIVQLRFDGAKSEWVTV